MGCATSKLDDLPAVALCKERCSSLDEVIRLRYSLSTSHLSYFHSLSVSPSFSSFFHCHDPITPSFPPKRSSDLHHDDDDSDDDSDHFHLHHDSGDLSPLPLQQFPDHDGMAGFFGQEGGFFHVNYMRNKSSTPSVVYEQRPVTYQTVQFGETSSSSSSSMPPPGGYPPYPYQTSSSSHPGAAVSGGGVIYPNYGYPGYGNSGIGGGGYANSPPRQSYGAQAKLPPPPPSPPRASAWDFLNLFESYDKFQPVYAPTRDSKELNEEEEGIPDLEDEHEVVKEVRGNQKHVDLGKNNDHPKKGVVVDEEDEDDDDDEDDGDEFHRKAHSEASLSKARPSVASIGNDDGNGDGAEYEVHLVEKKVADGEGRSGQGGGGAARGSRSVAEALAEVDGQFKRASEIGSEVARMLEAGKLPYNRKHRGIILPAY